MAEVIEEFRVVQDRPQYKVSNLGNVMSFTGRILKPSLSGNHLKVGLKGRGPAISRAVHSLVAHAFLGVPEPYDRQICVEHINGDPMDCRADNLRYYRNYSR